ncbi:MAG: AAA family ATPase [Acidobacteriota bacterium]|nr:AAA family ATPase [Acidobacteriota bacterium]
MERNLIGYEVTELVYEGSQSLVYRARTRADGRPVIVKQAATPWPGEIERRRLHREFDIGCKFNSPYLSRYLGLDDSETTLYLIKEDLGEVGLHELPFVYEDNPALFLRIALGLARGLAVIHEQGVIHRDIKPNNLLFRKETDDVRITDFSIAVTLSEAEEIVEQEQGPMGSPAYMAPEQTGRVKRPVDFRADLYSLGMVLYQLAVGSLPFKGKDTMDWIYSHIARQPEPPHQVSTAVPEVISRLILKLIAKNPEDRYQSAAGLVRDLEDLSSRITDLHNLTDYPLGEDDYPRLFHISEGLFGRDAEIARLQRSLARVARGGVELALVHGLSGMGKSRLVHEIKGREPCLFVEGKFENLRRNKAFHAFIQVLEELIECLLKLSDREWQDRRQRLEDALDGNARLLFSLAPGLERMLGEQPHPPDLDPAESSRRLMITLAAFIGTFCQKDRPLVIFLDDLQWTDDHSLELLDHLMQAGGLNGLLVIVARRDEEEEHHPRMDKVLENLEDQGLHINKIHVTPLTSEATTPWFADSLSLPAAKVKDLASLIHNRARGCPFHMQSLLRSLHREGTIFLDSETGKWSWQLDEVRRVSIDWDLGSTLARELGLLPKRTLELLVDGACFGRSFLRTDLADLREEGDTMVAIGLEPAISRGLLWLEDQRYTFVHDQIQEAVDRAVDTRKKAERKAAVGRYLLPLSIKGRRPICETVDCLNAGRDLLVDSLEQLQLVMLNMRAARWSLDNLAFQDALMYLEIGIGALPADPWNAYKDQCLKIHAHALTAAMGAGALEKGLRWSRLLLEHDPEPLARVQYLVAMIKIHTLQGSYHEAIDSGKTALEVLGRSIPRNIAGSLKEKLAKIDVLLEGGEIESLIDLPAMTDARQIALLSISDALIAPCYFVNQELLSWLGVTMVHTAVQHGNHPIAAHGYASLALYLGPVKGEYLTAYRFGLVSQAVQEQFGFQNIANTLIFANNLAHWVVPIREVRAINRRMIANPLSRARPQYLGYFRMFELYVPFFQGIGLLSLSQGIADARAYMRSTGNLQMVDSVDGFALCLSMLLGVTQDRDAEIAAYIQRCEKNGSIMSLTQFNVLLGLVYLLEGNHAEGLRATAYAMKQEHYTLGHLSVAQACFFDALLAAAGYRETEDPSLMDRLLAARSRMAGWAETCPKTFKPIWTLISAELADLEERTEQAWRLYDEAIAGFHGGRFHPYEALAEELAGNFWHRRGKSPFSHHHRDRAAFLYRRWGAAAKAESLMQFDPYETGERSISMTTESREMVGLDVQSMVRAAQAIAGEVDVNACLKKIIREMLEHAGARFGAVILVQEEMLYIAARGNTDRVDTLEPKPIGEDDLPGSLVRYVRRTGKDIVLDGDYEQFVDDPYFHQRRPQSVLCTPLRYMDRITGCLYLENDIMTRVFSPRRMGPLQVLLAQAAISLDNARLYADMTDLNQALRREVEDRKRAESETRALNVELEQRVKQRTRELERAQQELVDQAHQAGMADIATSVLHNVGNILNSVIISAQNVSQVATGIKLKSFDRANDKLVEMAAALPELTEKDRMLIDFYSAYAQRLHREMNKIHSGTARIQDKVEVIRQVIEAQQSYASLGAQAEVFPIDEIVREACHIIAPMMERYGVDFSVHGRAPRPIPVQKVKLIHVLVNLLKNAREALIEDKIAERRITLTIGQDVERTFMTVADSGKGIPEDALDKIFNHGFTTKSNGHGFGLHSCANALTEMGGRIWAENGEVGARFHLEIPNEPRGNPKESVSQQAGFG